MPREEIQNTVQTLFKTEFENAIQSSMSTFLSEIDSLKQENAKLRDEVDSLEQYGRRELIRVGGIPENKEENTTKIVTEIVKTIDKEYKVGDIIRSHRVGNPTNSRQTGTKTGSAANHCASKGHCGKETYFVQQ